MCISAPFVCPKCSGFGRVWFDLYGSAHRSEIPCPVCDGKGLIWPDGSDGLKSEIAHLKAHRRGGSPHGRPPEAVAPHGLSGYIHERLICTECGKLVAANWVSRHRKMHEAA